MTDGTCVVDGVCEVTLETSDRSALEAFYTSALGLQVLSRDADRTCEDPAGNVLELWDFFQRGEGTGAVDALALPSG
ncbi:MAG: hypothetical protein QOH62_3881 [Solirubrobacteraceae bacterium]|jgi:catechol-2,3-dioxygenase|nr:hypothetical protein [Solirubrobacteraceae bacterium]